MKLYRAVSKLEFDDYKKCKEFRVGKNTLEGKQFFKTEAGVKEFIVDAKKQSYHPPYEYLFVVDVDRDCIERIQYAEQELDRFEAVTIYEEDLFAFNNCIKFTDHYGI